MNRNALILSAVLLVVAAVNTLEAERSHRFYKSYNIRSSSGEYEARGSKRSYRPRSADGIYATRNAEDAAALRLGQVSLMAQVEEAYVNMGVRVLEEISENLAGEKREIVDKIIVEQKRLVGDLTMAISLSRTQDDLNEIELLEKECELLDVALVDAALGVIPDPTGSLVADAAKTATQSLLGVLKVQSDGTSADVVDKIVQAKDPTLKSGLKACVVLDRYNKSGRRAQICSEAEEKWRAVRLSKNNLDLTEKTEQAAERLFESWARVCNGGIYPPDNGRNSPEKSSPKISHLCDVLDCDPSDRLDDIFRNIPGKQESSDGWNDIPFGRTQSPADLSSELERAREIAGKPYSDDPETRSRQQLNDKLNYMQIEADHAAGEIDHAERTGDIYQSFENDYDVPKISESLTVERTEGIRSIIDEN